MVKLNLDADTMFEVFGISEAQHDSLHVRIDEMIDSIQEDETESRMLKRFLSIARSKAEENYLIYQAGILAQLFRQFRDMANAAKNN